MNNEDRFAFIVGMGCKIVFAGLAYVGTMGLVAFQWFLGDKIAAAFILIVAAVILPVLTPSSEEIAILRHLTDENDE